MAYTREMQIICRALQKAGFEVEKARNGHWKVRNPDTGEKCQIPCSPRQMRGVLNSQTRLKRIGYTPQK